MASVTNPTRSAIWCAPLHRVIGPFGKVRCEDEQAAKVATHVFVVERDEPEPTRKEARKGAKAAKAEASDAGPETGTPTESEAPEQPVRDVTQCPEEYTGPPRPAHGIRFTG